MRVRDLLSRKPPEVVTIDPEADLGTAVRLLVEHGIGGLPVVSNGDNPVGFLSERDIVAMVHEGRDPLRALTVREFMRPIPACSADDSLEDVMGRMTRQHLRHLVVLDGGRVTGVVSVGDIVKQRLEQLETEAGVLRDYVAAQRAAR